jgi:hypothetical protein
MTPSNDQSGRAKIRVGSVTQKPSLPWGKIGVEFNLINVGAGLVSGIVLVLDNNKIDSLCNCLGTNL